MIFACFRRHFSSRQLECVIPLYVISQDTVATQGGQESKGIL